MVATRSDENILSGDLGFQGRVRAGIIAAAINIKNESWDVPFHDERATYATQILGSPDTYKLLFSNSVATDSLVINDATVNGTVVLTTANVAEQAALVTDGHIDSAIGGQYNSFFRTPG